jgi:hypothetical protein
MYYLTEFISGGLITTIFSYAASFYSYRPEYIKIIAFLWGVPLLYFYILYTSWIQNEQAAIDVTKHGLYGIVCTLIAMIMTLYLHQYGKYIVIGSNILFLLLVIGIYMFNALYKL